MRLTELGMLIEKREPHPEKAEGPIDETVLGIVVFLHPTINLFVFLSIIALQLLRLSYTLLAAFTLIEAKPPHPEKAEEAIEITELGMVKAVILSTYW